MYTRLPGSLASDEGSLDIERSEKLQSYPLLKKGQKHNHFGCLKQLLITVAHAASIIFCIGILSSAHRMYGKSRKDCIEKLNAYCRCPRKSYDEMLIRQQHLFWTQLTRTTKKYDLHTPSGITRQQKGHPVPRWRKRGKTL